MTRTSSVRADQGKDGPLLSLALDRHGLRPTNRYALATLSRIDADRSSFNDIEEHVARGCSPLWASPRVAGPAYTVQCPAGDNLMLHAAIHRAEPGSVVAVESGDVDYALAGGNGVCAVARRRGIAAFVVDGVVRDLGEVREAGFPVFSRGVIPIPGTKRKLGALGAPVRVGGVLVHPGDIVVADEEGIVVTPAARQAEVLGAARAKLAEEAEESLDDWAAQHRARIETALAERGFTG
ncbi:RraA family protein [Kitasatospora sp. NBC_00240]|uniref:RraA family protein n=1 Tax=Kitasatospora sp. NBC_00240 TaxID=2903567 RepID=UPI002259B7D7|nr:RraA family protein [Kitasatospora sp. NBC_00240]MCX5213232.1 RraA family protein [Kitasatospora sp. NBC_00240]